MEINDISEFAFKFCLSSFFFFDFWNKISILQECLFYVSQIINVFRF